MAPPDNRVRQRSLRHFPRARPAARFRECRRADRLFGRARGLRRLRADVRRGVYTLKLLLNDTNKSINQHFELHGRVIILVERRPVDVVDEVLLADRPRAAAQQIRADC